MRLDFIFSRMLIHILSIESFSGDFLIPRTLFPITYVQYPNNLFNNYPQIESNESIYKKRAE